jgi:hypothetical protein
VFPVQEEHPAFAGQGQGLAVAFQVLGGKIQAGGEGLAFLVEDDAHRLVLQVQTGNQVLGNSL